MHFLVELGGAVGLMGEPAVGSVVFVNDGFVLEGSDQHPLPDVELPIGEEGSLGE